MTSSASSPKGTARRLAGKCANPKVASAFAKGQQAVWLCRAGRATQFRTSRATRTLRSANLETLNEQFKGIFEAHGPVPTRGLRATRRFALGAVFVYQLALLARALVFSASRRIGSAQYCSIAPFDRHARQQPYPRACP